LAQVEIITEQSSDTGWQFEAQLLDDAGSLHRRTVRLSWADYNLWSRDGADPPEHVAEAVLRFLLDRMPAGEMRERFDAAIARRLFDDADEVIPALIGR